MNKQPPVIQPSFTSASVRDAVAHDAERKPNWPPTNLRPLMATIPLAEDLERMTVTEEESLEQLSLTTFVDPNCLSPSPVRDARNTFYLYAAEQQSITPHTVGFINTGVSIDVEGSPLSHAQLDSYEPMLEDISAFVPIKRIGLDKKIRVPIMNGSNTEVTVSQGEIVALLIFDTPYQVDLDVIDELAA